MFPSANYNRRFRKPNPPNRVPIKKLLLFQLGSEQYAISIEKVQHVINEFTPQGVLPNGLALVEYQNHIITLVELTNLFVSSQDARERQYLIVCLLKENSRLGIPIPEMPKVLEVPADKITEVPEVYQTGKLPNAIEKIIHIAQGKVVFYINVDKLIK